MTPPASTTSGGGGMTNFTTNGYSSTVPSIQNILWQPESAYGINGILNAYGRLNNIRT